MKLLLIILLIFSFLSCSSTKKKPAQKQISLEQIEAFNQMVGSLKGQGNASKIAKSSDRPISLKKGQWVSFVTRYNDEKNQDASLTTFKVIDFKKNSLILEVEIKTLTGKEKNIIQYEIDHYPRPTSFNTSAVDFGKLAEKMVVKKLRMQHSDGTVSEVPLQMLDHASQMAKQSMIALTPQSKIIKKSCQTDYFSSENCLFFSYSGSIAGNETQGDVLAHSQVPIISFLLSKDAQVTNTVIAFGLVGAKSVFSN